MFCLDWEVRILFSAKKLSKRTTKIDIVKHITLIQSKNVQKSSQEQHSETPKGSTSHAPLGKLNHDQRPFSWPVALQRALAKKKTRDISLKTCNPDHQIKYPNECRDNPEHKLLHQCHPEAEKRIEHDFKVAIQKTIVPVVDRPKRMNRA